MEYDGGSWHIEGMEYEHIIASGIYYYDIENIKGSYLQFRQGFDHNIYYEDNNSYGVWDEYKMRDGDEMNQWLGKIAIKRGQEKLNRIEAYTTRSL